MRVAQIVQQLSGAAQVSEGLIFVLEMMHISIAQDDSERKQIFYLGYHGQTEGWVGWVGRKHVFKVENDPIFVK